MRFHVVGIGGAGMSAVARLLAPRGEVSGSDSGRWPLAEALRALGVTVHDRFDSQHVIGADVVVRSSAYGDENVEVAAARSAGIPVWRRHDAWRFLVLSPAVAVITNVEHDHVDHFPTREEYAEAFLQFALRTIPGGTLVACADDDGARRLAELARERLRGRADVLTYGTSPDAEAWISDVRAEGEGMRATLRLEARHVPIALSVPGVHNVRNAAAAVLAAHCLGVPPSDAARGLASASLPARRLEVLGRAAGITVVDDYAHHPTEIRASVAAMRERTAGRVLAVFQPHTPSRLRAFFDEFAAALGEPDLAIVAETFSSARERPDPSGLARTLATRIGGLYAPDVEAAARELAERAASGDTVLVLGAGDIREAGERLLDILASRAPA